MISPNTEFGFLNSLDLSNDVIRRLSLNLSSIVEGRDEVFRSPTGGDLSPDSILNGWDAIYQETLENIVPELQDMEMANRSKFGPRSIAVPWSERKQSVYDSFKRSDALKSLPNQQRISPPSNRSRLRPLTLKKAASYLKPSTNSGLPFYVKKRNVLDDVLVNFDSLIKRKDPCVLFTRTQENKKTRTVWGYPIADTLNEMRFYRPLLDYQKTLEWRSALTTPENVDNNMTNLILMSRLLDNPIVSLDLSQYDTTVKGEQQKAAFSYIKTLFQSSYHEEIDYIAERFLNIGLITPDGILDSPHGVPSGSTFTNEVDSIVQYLIMLEAGAGPATALQIQGDDAVIGWRNVDDLFSTYRDYGLIINNEKSLISKDCALYLQSLYHVAYRRKDNEGGLIRGVYPTYRALNRIIFPERFDDFSSDDISGKDYFAIKNLSILENCKNHPKFVDFVKYIIKIDKYSLNISDQGIASYVRLKAKQEGKDVNFASWSYGAEIRGIKAFESYKIVKEFAS